MDRKAESLCGAWSKLRSGGGAKLAQPPSGRPTDLVLLKPFAPRSIDVWLPTTITQVVAPDSLADQSRIVDLAFDKVFVRFAAAHRNRRLAGSAWSTAGSRRRIGATEGDEDSEAANSQRCLAGVDERTPRFNSPSSERTSSADLGLAPKRRAPPLRTARQPSGRPRCGGRTVEEFCSHAVLPAPRSRRSQPTEQC